VLSWKRLEQHQNGCFSQFYVFFRPVAQFIKAQAAIDLVAFSLHFDVFKIYFFKNIPVNHLLVI
jgi:accessory gene regulator protein AgrB